MRFFEALKFWDKKEQITGFAAIDSLGKAHLMMDKGMLEALYLKAVCFGGQETPENRVYVPIGIGRLKEKHDEEVKKLFEEKPELIYACIPKYRGASRVPYELNIRVTMPEPGKEELYNETIQIW